MLISLVSNPSIYYLCINIKPTDNALISKRIPSIACRCGHIARLVWAVSMVWVPLRDRLTVKRTYTKLKHAESRMAAMPCTSSPSLPLRAPSCVRRVSRLSHWYVKPRPPLDTSFIERPSRRTVSTKLQVRRTFDT